MRIENNEISLNNIEKNAWTVKDAANLPPKAIHQIAKIQTAIERVKLEFGSAILVPRTGKHRVERL